MNKVKIKVGRKVYSFYGVWCVDTAKDKVIWLYFDQKDNISPRVAYVENGHLVGCQLSELDYTFTEVEARKLLH